MIEYEQRNQVLRDLRFASYKEYLLSQRWAKIRRRVLDANMRTCVRCGEEANQVHHLSYARECLLGKDDGSLVAVCPVCHNIAEMDTQGRKRTQYEANRWLLRDITLPNQRKKKKHRRNKKTKKSRRNRKRKGTTCVTPF